jgi:hypothetical protein
MSRPTGHDIVRDDSQSSHQGAFDALAFGMGASQGEHVFHPTLPAKSKNMRISVEGKLAEGVISKDVVQYIVTVIGTAPQHLQRDRVYRLSCQRPQHGDTYVHPQHVDPGRRPRGHDRPRKRRGSPTSRDGP